MHQVLNDVLVLTLTVGATKVAVSALQTMATEVAKTVVQWAKGKLIDQKAKTRTIMILGPNK
jgi:hypothetical protein